MKKERKEPKITPREEIIMCLLGILKANKHS
jgi:hypothetical protein